MYAGRESFAEGVSLSLDVAIYLTLATCLVLIVMGLLDGVSSPRSKYKKRSVSSKRLTNRYMFICFSSSYVGSAGSWYPYSPDIINL